MAPIMPDITCEYSSDTSCSLMLPNVSQVTRVLNVIGRHYGASPRQVRALISAIQDLGGRRQYKFSFSDRLGTDAERWRWGGFTTNQWTQILRRHPDTAWARSLSFHSSRMPDGRVRLWHIAEDLKPFNRELLCHELGLDAEVPLVSARVIVAFPEPDHYESLEIPLAPLSQVIDRLFAEACVVKEGAGQDYGDIYDYVEHNRDLAERLAAALRERATLALADDPEFYAQPRHPLVPRLYLEFYGSGEMGSEPYTASPNYDSLDFYFPYRIWDDGNKRHACLALTIYAPHPPEAATNLPLRHQAEEVRTWLEEAYRTYCDARSDD